MVSPGICQAQVSICSFAAAEAEEAWVGCAPAAGEELNEGSGLILVHRRWCQTFCEIRRGHQPVRR